MQRRSFLRLLFAVLPVGVGLVARPGPHAPKLRRVGGWILRADDLKPG